MLKAITCNLLIFNTVLGGEGEQSRVCKRKTARFSNFSSKTQSEAMEPTAKAYPGFCSMKRLRVFLLPPGRDASPSQVTSPQCVGFPNNLQVLIYTPGPGCSKAG